MKKLLVAFLLMILAGCAHSPVQAQSINYMPNPGDELVEVYTDFDSSYGYDKTSMTREGDVVSFTALIVFESAGEDGVIAAVGNAKLNCMEETVKVETNHLLNKKGKKIRESEVDGDFVPIEEDSPMKDVYESICRTPFRRSIVI